MSLPKLDLKTNERVVLERLVDDALDGIDSPCPLPTFKIRPENGKPPFDGPRRLDSAQARDCEFALVEPVNLTREQKEYLADLLEKVAGLCREKAARMRTSMPARS